MTTAEDDCGQEKAIPCGLRKSLRNIIDSTKKGIGESGRPLEELLANVASRLMKGLR